MVDLINKFFSEQHAVKQSVSEGFCKWNECMDPSKNA